MFYKLLQQSQAVKSFKQNFIHKWYIIYFGRSKCLWEIPVYKCPAHWSITSSLYLWVFIAEGHVGLGVRRRTLGGAAVTVAAPRTVRHLLAPHLGPGRHKLASVAVTARPLAGAATNQQYINSVQIQLKKYLFINIARVQGQTFESLWSNIQETNIMIMTVGYNSL